MLDVISRIEHRVSMQSSGCWFWTGAMAGGYGRISVNGRVVGAHQASFEAFIGSVPDGQELDHTCRNRPCINPTHVEPVTSSENKRRSPLVGRTRRSWRHREGGNNGAGLKTHCQEGHPFTADNTYIRPNNGGRGCKTCRNAASARRRARAHKVAA